jgi:hypothetical protein
LEHKIPVRPPCIVDRRSERGGAVKSAAAASDKTTAKHGIHQDEMKRISDAVHFMRSACPNNLWHLSTDHGSGRNWQVWKRITKLQGSHGLPKYSVKVIETRGGVHAHIVFVGDRDIADRLSASGFKVTHVYDAPGLVGYLSKERTSQAQYGRTLRGGRIKGSHRLEGGGAHVRLSGQLRLDAIAAGYVDPWQQTNARRSDTRKDYRKRALTRRAPRPSGQILLFPELSKPVARLHSFGGGLIPPAVAEEAEFRRRLLNLSQRELAALVGLSQGQYANAIRGHDPISARATNRLRDVLLSRAYCALHQDLGL